MPERSPRGTYLRIADALRVKITGDSEVTALPSEADLMAEHGVARTTIKRALDQLAAEGLIVSRPGVGWTVVGAVKTPPLLDQLTALFEDLKAGDPFPSEKKLSEQTGASRHTVRRALAQLEGAGVLEARHGKGRFVRTLPPQHV
ncbi:GntR family transcriptional regulator [Kitasatospora sp. NPDC096147]|uniref:GntR family transcriptional regulator n=1 Tax=Kitasatospora sp. NPDC096147 TaxID=3364093 RepID=UPI003819942B